MYCYNCGLKLKDDSNFCGGCGTNISQLKDFLNNDHSNNKTLESNDNQYKDNDNSKKINLKGILPKNSKFIKIGCALLLITCIIIKIFTNTGGVHSMGDKVKFNGLEISVKSFDVQKGILQIEDKMYSIAPEAGMAFAITEVEVYNDGNSTYPFLNGARSFSTLEYDGKEFDSLYFTSPPEKILGNVQLEPMISKTGYVVYQIPEKVANDKNKINIKFNERQIDEKNNKWTDKVKSISFKVK